MAHTQMRGAAAGSTHQAFWPRCSHLATLRYCVCCKASVVARTDFHNLHELKQPCASSKASHVLCAAKHQLLRAQIFTTCMSLSSPAPAAKPATRSGQVWSAHRPEIPKCASRQARRACVPPGGKGPAADAADTSPLPSSRCARFCVAGAAVGAAGPRASPRAPGAGGRPDDVSTALL